MLALEAETYDGPWTLDQDLEKLNAFAKLTRETGPWRVEVSTSAYSTAGHQQTRFRFVPSKAD
jgi:hypothetical protein